MVRRLQLAAREQGKLGLVFRPEQALRESEERYRTLVSNIPGMTYRCVFDDDRTMEFLSEESCGKCAPCREGTQVMAEILGRLAKGEGVHEDIGVLEELSSVMMLSSLCGLGQTAPIPVKYLSPKCPAVTAQTGHS